MRIAYLDCFAGLSGDMFLGALLGAGVERAVLDEAVAAMKLGASLKVETVDRSGISSVKMHVLVDDGAETRLAESGAPKQPMRDAQESQPKTPHVHKKGHTHSIGPGNMHGRSLSVIKAMIEASGLNQTVRRTATRAFELLGAAEAKIHNVTVDELHFHEVGAIDAIVDIVAAAAGIEALSAKRWIASPVNVGGGMVDCAHGRFPVPAPATAELLCGVPTYAGPVAMETVTPTGAALLRVLIEERGLTFGAQPAMRVGQIGYGAGTRNPGGFPNVLRLMVGEEEGANAAEILAVIETACDDLNPQILAYVAEKAIAMGALDAMLTPVLMKKGRPGTLLTLLVEVSESQRFEELLLRETSTLGVRTRVERRSTLKREHVSVETAYGAIRVKLGRAPEGHILNAQPEFEDCRAAAERHGVPVKIVHQTAFGVYLNREKTP